MTTYTTGTVTKTFTKTRKVNLALPLAIAICGSGVMLSPMPPLTKLMVGLSGTALCAFQAVEIKNKQSKASTDLGAKEALLEAKGKELEASLIALEVAEAELNSQKRLAQVQIDEKKKSFQAEMAREQDKLLLSLEAYERERRYALEKELAQSRQLAIANMNEEIATRQAAIQQLDIERAEKLALIEQEAKVAKEVLEAELAELEEYGKGQLAAIQSDIRLEKEKWEAEQKLQQQRLGKELEEAEAAIAEHYAGIQDQMIADLNELKGQLEAQAKANFESWLIPHCQEMDAKIKEIEALKSTVQMLREEIAANRDIKLCPEAGTVHGNQANAVLIWFKQQGQYLDYQSSTVLPDGTYIINFLPWYVGSKAEKAIKGLLLACQVQFGLQEPPLFQPNGEARAWTLTMFPSRSRGVALSEFYTPKLPETSLGETFRDIEPELRDGVAKQLNYEQQVAEMMAFRPPVPLPKPRSHQISELELMTCKWYYFWRGLATDGAEANVTTREGLLWYVYGVREGRASATYDPILCESLGDRVKRILAMLKVEAVELEQKLEDEE